MCVKVLVTYYYLKLQRYLKYHLENFLKINEICPLHKVTDNIQLRLSPFPRSVCNSTF